MRLTQEQINKAKQQLEAMEPETRRDWVVGPGPDGAYVIYTVDDEGEVRRHPTIGPWEFVAEGDQIVTIGTSPAAARWTWSVSLSVDVPYSEIVGPDGNYTTPEEAEANGWSFFDLDGDPSIDWGDSAYNGAVDWTDIVEWSGEDPDQWDGDACSPYEEMRDMIDRLGRSEADVA